MITMAGAGAARAYQRGTSLFSRAQQHESEEGIITLVSERGLRWRVEEEALVQANDPTHRLPRLPSHMAYWFGWYAFYPATDVYGETP